ncbi:fimbrillin family protein [Phocaeicola vulgatus]|uniref:Fimbrillin family protein n=1 Tax=Phocaeicola vulgatus TaxID=821 RepID=A0A415BT14_PHOVU|nr:fimbrillin family protein [Phocaeicola vulgatus]RHI92147.1 hypothetical protein DW150_08055 [Phocaeicola vulgatus]
MNRSRLHSLRNIAVALLACAGFASCSQDELAEKDTSLPAGKYPLELTASIGEAVAAPATRGTVHGQWPYNGNIVLHYARSRQYPDEDNINWGNRFICNIDANGTVNITDGFYDSTPYWENSKETIYIYTGTNPLDFGTGRSSWTVEADQSDEGKLNESDYLVAYEAFAFQKDYTYTLRFRHLTSKITVNLKQSDYLKAQDPDDVKVTLATKNEQWYIEGSFKGQPKEITMVGEGDKSRAQEIIPYKNPNQTDAGIYATYEAVLIPQQITDTGKIIQIKVGDAIYNYTIVCPNEKFSGGENWIYNITVKENELEVSIDYKENIGWGTNGNTGSGEVELP